jgi:cytochrome P450
VGAGRDVDDIGLQRQHLLEIRYVAGQLLGGSMSTLRVQRRAELCGDSLRARIAGVSHAIRSAWGACGEKCSSGDIERNAVGLAWVSHPVTVQSGALVVQELLSRPEVYEALRSRAADTKADSVWADDDFRKCVQDHVLELMRFRPVFPVLSRAVPRDTEFEAGGNRNAKCPGGGKVGILSIAALFDPRAVSDSGRFCPHRKWTDQDLRWLMFGYGDRRCPAREFAVDILTSALIGLLTMPELRLARDEGKAILYDGPLMSRMRLRSVR